ncbi:MAG: hypothetical protein RLZZ244_274 [Verrucomicrobiota bacterium]
MRRSPAPSRLRLPLVLLRCIVPLLLSSPASPAAAPTPEALHFFESKVRPLLVERCYKCHSEDGDNEGDLTLDTRQGWQTGGRSGPAIIPGKPEESLLIGSLSHENRELKMPPKKKLAPAEVEILTQWVAMGAPDPREGSSPAKPTSVAPTTDAKHFWAFQAVSRPTIPPVRRPHWVQTPVDAFILSELEANALSPAPQADRRTLLRRLSYDLTGLPPTPEEQARFLSDPSPEAYRHLVERLLASPRYGEHWGRHWLDVARYSDSNGMDENTAYAQAYRYRDYVIDSFNHDKPFDQFVREQVAGDLLPLHTASRAKHEPLIATGFLVVGPKFLAEDDPVKLQMDIVDEQIDTIGRAFLGMTFGCARCHDHKIDPISTADYYALAGILKSTKTMETLTVVSRWNERPLGTEAEFSAWKKHSQKIKALEAKLKTAREAAVNALPEEHRKKSKAEQEKQFPPETLQTLRGLEASLKELTEAAPHLDFAMAVEEQEKPADVRIHYRGNHMTQGPVVPRRIPEVFKDTGEVPISPNQSGRLELARWLSSNRNPLTARVFVNRVWHWHFGKGIVRSPDYFGKLGEAPTHPKLLDWLADEFMRSGWSVKHLHRLILLSSTWQMSGQANPRALAEDPDNRLWSHIPKRRLEAESIRDSMLSLARRLDTCADAPPLPMKSHERVSTVGAPVHPKLYERPVRSVYLPVVRSDVYAPLSVFDFPDPTTGVGCRDTTLVPAQALFLMNHPMASENALATAQWLMELPKVNTEERLEHLFCAAFSRPPSRSELEATLAFLSTHEVRWKSQKPEAAQEAPLRAWQAVCRAVFSSNEFLFLN